MRRNRSRSSRRTVVLWIVLLLSSRSKTLHYLSHRCLILVAIAYFSCNAVLTCDIKLCQIISVSSTFVWNNFDRNYFKIISEAYCSSWILSNTLNVAAILEIISDAVICKVKLWNNSEIISVFYFTCKHRHWLHVKLKTETISKLFHNNFISHVTAV